MPTQKRKPKLTGPRSEVFAMRLDPQLKFIAELAARTQRRSLASFVEWSLDLALRNAMVDQDSKSPISVRELGQTIWDIDAADRLANLAFAAPSLMTYDEQVLWKLICVTGYVWRAKADAQMNWVWDVKPATLRRDRLRECWPALQRVATGAAGREVLPKTSTRSPLELIPGSHN